MSLTREQVLKILRPLWMGEEAARDAMLTLRESLGPEDLRVALDLEELRLYLATRARALDPFHGLQVAVMDGDKARIFPNVRITPQDREEALAAWIAADSARATRYEQRKQSDAERLEAALARLSAKREVAA